MHHKTLTWQNKSGRSIFAQAWAPEASPLHVVILVHGLGEHSGRYVDWVKLFVESQIATYAIDLHGHGQTTGSRGHTEDFELIYDDINHLLETVRNNYPDAKIHLYGHSMGGALVLGFIASRVSDSSISPVSSVIATGTAIRPGFEPPTWKVTLGSWLNLFVPWLTLGNELDPAWLSSSSDVVSRYKADPLVHDRISVRWYNEWLCCVKRIPLIFDKKRVPVFMLHGSKDKATSPAAAQEVAKLIDAKFKLLPGAFHELHHEACGREVFSDVLSWIREL